jgi:hypothetical protein
LTTRCIVFRQGQGKGKGEEEKKESQEEAEGEGTGQLKEGEEGEPKGEVEEAPLVIRVEFLAKPWPQPGDIRWFSDLANGTRVALEEVEAGLAYRQGDLEAGPPEEKYQLATSLHITNLTNNIRKRLSIFFQVCIL